MNTPNNRRRRESQGKMERVFIELLQSREIEEITVTDICAETGLNRSTFYANYADIYDLAEKIGKKLEAEVATLYEDDPFNKCGLDYLRLFRHIRDNSIFYKTYFKLGFDSKIAIDITSLKTQNINVYGDNLEYHIEFHRAGLNAIIKKWLSGGCAEQPEQMVKIIQNEYVGRSADELSK